MQKIYTNVLCKGNKILYRGYDSNLNRVQDSISYSPVIFIETKNESQWKSLEGKNLELMDFPTIKDCKEFIEQYKDVEGVNLYGNDNFAYNFLEGHEDCELNADNLRIAYLDIETECENGFPSVENSDQKINAITVRMPWCKMQHDTVTFCTESASPVNDRHFVSSHSSESEMLTEFIFWWRRMDFDIITGWNVNLFDIPYLINRSIKLLGEKETNQISPWDYIKSRKVVVMNKENIAYEICGISILDYYDLYKKFTFVNRESYRLDHIATVELGEKKATFEGFNTIQDLYKKDFNKFIQYNYHDVILVEKLEKKMKLLQLAVDLAYSSKVNFGDVFSQVRMWDSIIYYHLMKKHIVIPQRRVNENNKNTQFTGAYVKEPILGMHKWIVSFDLDSLYPSLIQLFNISPETKMDFHANDRVSVDKILEKDSEIERLVASGKKRDSCMAANGIFFSTKKQGFLAELMEKMYEERKMYKKKLLECKARLKEENDVLSEKEKEQLKLDISKYHNFQLVRKINLNSAFGTVGNQYFRHFDIDLAEAITLSGQLVIRWIERKLNEFLNKMAQTNEADYIIASDTDSVYICLDNIVQKHMNGLDNQKIVKRLDKFCNEILTPYIEKQYEELKNYLNCPVQKLHMKREGIANKGVWTAKKRYMLNIFMGEDNVLLSVPETKVMGIEVVRSSTPQPVRSALRKCIEIILNKDEQELIDYIQKFKQEFSSLPIEEIAFPRSCNDVNKYYDSSTIFKKSTPIAVKGALIYNNLIRTMKLTKKYNLIRDGEKVKFIYLKEPNLSGSKVISFSQVLPAEFNLHNSVDFDLQFEKSFLDPLKTITDCINWKIEKRATLESLFE